MNMPNQLTLFAEDGHAKTFPWLESVLVWLESGADSSLSSCVSLIASAPVGFSEKMFPDFCRLTEDGTWGPSPGRWGNWGIGSPTAFLTLSGSEFHSGAG